MGNYGEVCVCVCYYIKQKNCRWVILVKPVCVRVPV